MALLCSFLDVTKICRLCLSQDRPLSAIFTDANGCSSNSTDDTFISMPSKILSCVQIEVNFEHNLPDKICNRCTEQVENWFKFKELCDNANSLLLQFAAGMHSNKYEVQETCSITNSREILEIPETSSDFYFEDVSLLDHDSFFQKIDSKEELVQESLSLSVGECTNTTDVNKDEVKDEAIEEHKREANQKWKEKYSRIYATKYECGICECVFTKFRDLLLHDKTDHKDIEMVEVCESCNQVFVSKQRLNSHVQLKHKDKIHECEMCGFKSVSEKSLKVHKVRHTQKFVCKICNVVSSSHSSLRDHVKIHSSEKTFNCDTCNQTFKQRQTLQRHMKSHSSISRVDFKCTICSCIFKTVDSFKNHKNFHNKETTYICETCGSVFKSKSSLSVHMLNHQSKKHVCMFCDKGFTTNNLLHRHINVHMSRLFTCSLCEKSFNRADTLSLHMKTHSSLQTVFCKYCEKSFKLNKYLKRHIERIHEIPKQ